MGRMWWYTLGVLALWVISPELKRLSDWQFGFQQFEIWSILPIFSLVPHVWSLTAGGGWRRLPPLLRNAAWLWIGGFAYALIMAIFSGHLLSGSYDFVEFVFPIGLGLWVAADDTPFLLAYRRLTRMLFALTTVISVYGIVQYVFAPAWDILWLQHQIQAGALGFGYPAPFRIRVFSTLNSSGPFAHFLAMMFVLALPELTIKKPLLLAQVSLWLIPFALCLVRTGWIMVGVGLVVYMLFSPRRFKLLGALALMTILMVGIVAVLPSALGNKNVLTTLSSRFETFTDLANDGSGIIRQQNYANGFGLVSSTPFGLGLGVVTVASALNSEKSSGFDSGILGRLVEMGIPGAILYAIPLLLLFLGTLHVWTQAGFRSDVKCQSVAAMFIGLSIAFLVQQTADDASAILLLAFWLLACLALQARPQNQMLGLQVAGA